jgi:hypothetical protein
MRRHGLVRTINPDTAEGRKLLERVREIHAEKSAKERRNGLSGTPLVETIPRETDALSKRLNRYKCDEIKDFKKWLSRFYLISGQYNITETGKSEVPRKMEFMEFAKKTSKRGVLRLVRARLEMLIDEGKLGDVEESRWIEAHGDWKAKKNERKIVMAKFVEMNKINPRETSTEVFTEHGLEGLLRSYGSLYSAFVDIDKAHSLEDIARQAADHSFSDKKAYPWQLKRTPAKVWTPALKRHAVEWVLWKTEKSAPKRLHQACRPAATATRQ